MNRMRISVLAGMKARRIVLAMLAGVVLLATAGFREGQGEDEDSRGDRQGSRAAIDRFWQV